LVFATVPANIHNFIIKCTHVPFSRLNMGMCNVCTELFINSLFPDGHTASVGQVEQQVKSGDADSLTEGLITHYPSSLVGSST